MPEPTPPSDERLEVLLAAVRASLAYPPTPPITTAVVARLSAERTAGSRPPLPGLALWSRRRVLVLVAVGVLAALALAAAARLAIGSIQIRVQPEAASAPALPPLDPEEIGVAGALEAAERQAGFRVALPAGPPPDEVYLVRDVAGDPGVVVAWRRGGRYPTIPGTEWGLLLMTFRGDVESTQKTLGGFGDFRETSVGGRRALWIDVPHEIAFETEEGIRGPYRVLGNVLIWETGDGITYRLETSLARADAIALAETL